MSLDAIGGLAGELPCSGVPGHQCIGQAYGAEIVAAPHLMHGKTSESTTTESALFGLGCPTPSSATRYHSLVVRPIRFRRLIVTARTYDGVVMGCATGPAARGGGAVRPVELLTASGPALLANFLAQLGTPAPA